MAQRVTIVDVAREAGVAISTVSAALNGRDGVAAETRGRIEQTAERLGWVPSVRGRSLVSQQTRAIGLVIQRPATVLEADPFFVGFIGGIETVLERNGYALTLQLAANHARMVERLRHLVLSGMVDGVVLTDIRSGDDRFALMADLGVPAVAVNAEPPSGIGCATQAHAPGMRAAVEHLIHLGHRDIAYVGGAPGYVHTIERERVWRDTLLAVGLPLGRLVVGDFSVEGGVRAAGELLGGGPRPTAVVCANDLSAIGFVARARELRVDVPTEVSVTGFDGIPMSAFVTPALTTVQTSPHELGEVATGILLSAIRDGRADRREIAPASLLVRSSTAPPR